MRLFEFVQNLDEYIDKTPVKNPEDPETGLFLNDDAAKWRSQSPYLYAVKVPTGSGYYAQIHIPQGLYNEHIKDMQKRWPKAPSSLFMDDANNRMSLKQRFADPRQAAWFAQEILLDTGNMKAEDVILDRLDELYGNGDGYYWHSLLSKVPTFTGKPLDERDADEFFKDKDELLRQRAEREAQLKKKQTLATNAGNYENDRKKQIKRELTAWFTRMGPAVAKKKFGKPLTGDELSARLDKEIDDKGINFFLTGPGSVKLKDIDSLKF